MAQITLAGNQSVLEKTLGYGAERANHDAHPAAHTSILTKHRETMLILVEG
jgi:hypothetical protein